MCIYTSILGFVNRYMQFGLMDTGATLHYIGINNESGVRFDHLCNVLEGFMCCDTLLKGS